jgi:hypothetical protein
MSTKVRKCREQARVTFPAPEEEDKRAKLQRHRGGWRGVNGGLEPRLAPSPRKPHGHCPPPLYPGPDP